jgi:acyl-lipid omega-6 desaturase (Delta-12 desaturase)
MAVGGAVSSDSRTWRAIVARYQSPDTRRALWQLATTLVPLFASFVIMYRLLAVSIWWPLLLAIPTAGLLVRTFILMHDCAHGSFLGSRRLNHLVGAVTGLLTLTPFEQWRHEHALHHASAGDLGRRGHGDVDTLTVREYLARTAWGRLRYRLARHPAVFLGLGPLYFLIEQRVPAHGPAAGRRQIMSVWGTNAAIVAVGAALALLVGVRAVLLVYLPAYYFALMAGILLFFVQHQFEGTYWEQHGSWNYVDAAIAGSSHFRLPPILRWFTGSIGLHHVHHLGPRIPNYNLQRCHDENALFHGVTTVTLSQSVRSFRLALWDEEARRLVGIDEVRRRAILNDELRSARA